MANKITEFTEDVEVIQKLGDYPNTDDGMSADELKAQFDKAPAAIKKFLNEEVVPAVQNLQNGIAKVDKTLTQDGYFADAKATGEAIAAAKAEATQQMQQAAQEAQAAADAAIAEADTATVAAAKAQAAAEQAASAYDSANNAKDHVNEVSAAIDSLKDQIDSAVSQAADNAVIAQAAADAAIAEADTATIAAAKAQAAAETLETDTTLSVAGVAADAKATGDRIAEVQENLDNANGDIGLLDCSLGIVEQSVQALQNGQIICSASGEVVTVHDASDHALKGLTLYGKTKQFTTTGKNLLDVSEFTYHLYLADGTMSDNADFMLFDFIPVKAGDVLSLSGNYIGSGAEFLRYAIFDAEKTFISRHGATANAETVTINISQNGYIRIFIAHKEYAIKTLQLEQNPTATAYEPYTGGMPSPNPDYPQELESVGDSGSVGVNVCGKNLLPMWDDLSVFTGAGLSATKDADGTIVLSGTTTKNLSSSAPARYLSAGTYTISNIDAMTDEMWLSVSNISDFMLGTNTNPLKCTATIADMEKARLHFFVRSGRTLSNFRLLPQVERGSNATAYEPYVSGGALTAQTPNGLPGIPVSSGGNYTDANGQQWICDEVDLARGVYVQRVEKIVFDGSDDETWSSTTTQSGSIRFVYVIPTIKQVAAGVVANLLNNQLYATSANDIYANDTEGCTIRDSNLIIHTAQIQSLDALKAHLVGTPMMVLYELATPIETPLSAEEIAAFKALHTNKPNTTVYTDSNAGIKLDYVADTKTYIDNKFAELAATIVSNT